MGRQQAGLVELVQSMCCNISEVLWLRPSFLSAFVRKDDDDDQDPELKKLRAGLSSQLYKYSYSASLFSKYFV